MSKHCRKRRLLRVPAAVRYLDGIVKEPTLRSWILQKKLEFVKVGRTVAIPTSALDAIIEHGTVKAVKRG
jgi:excisionase family DNA binding protein